MLDYIRPASLEDALRVLAESPRTVLAGGTDLYAATGAPRLAGPVLDVAGLPELGGISFGPGGVRIGAAVTWAEVVRDRTLPPAFDALRQAGAEVGGRQVQVAGTLAGNLCNASPAADGVPPLLVLDAQVELASLGGTRRVALAEFITGPRRTLREGRELVSAILVPAAALSGRSRFLKLGARRHLVISIAMAAVRVEVADGSITRAALAVGACGPVAQRLAGLEAALAGATPAEAPGRITDAAVAAALSPIDDIRATAAYRAEAAAELLRRAFCEALA